MLPKSKRIERGLFPLFKGARSLSNDLFYMMYTSYIGTGAKFCFSVSKKIVKNATLRNKMRRFGYRIVEKYIESFQKPLLVKVSWKKELKDEDEAKIALEQLINKLK